MHNNNLQAYPRKLMCKDLEGAGPNSFKTMSRHFPGKTQVHHQNSANYLPLTVPDRTGYHTKTRTVSSLHQITWSISNKATQVRTVLLWAVTAYVQCNACHAAADRIMLPTCQTTRYDLWPRAWICVVPCYDSTKKTCRMLGRSNLHRKVQYLR
jgi:hypothetical protein